MNIDLIAYLQNMAASEILQHVPQETLAEIKKTDPNPILEAYVIAHPGESKTHVVGVGQKILKWGESIIKAIKDKIKPGTPVFNGHNADNSHENRTVIGRIIATVLTQNGVINIIHRLRDFLHLQADVASFEAPPLNIAEGTELDGHEVQPHELGDITGVALAHSATAKPAFSGAIKLAALQCLTKENNMPVTLQEVQEFLKENKDKIGPLTLFDPRELLALDEIKAEISKHKGSENLWNEAQRLKFELSEVRKELATLKSESEKILKEKDTEIMTYKGKEVFKAQIEKRDKLTDKHKAYIEKHREKLTLEPGKDIEAQVNAFLDTTIGEFDELSKIFAPGTEAPGQKNENLNPAPITKGEAEKHFPD